MSTNFFVLQYQRDLANARSIELRARIDYKISVANLERIMKVGREKKNIKVVDEK